MFTHAIVKDRKDNTVVAKFRIANHAKQYCETLNKAVEKKRYHWHETNGSM